MIKHQKNYDFDRFKRPVCCIMLCISTMYKIGGYLPLVCYHRCLKGQFSNFAMMGHFEALTLRQRLSLATVWSGQLHTHTIFVHVMPFFQYIKLLALPIFIYTTPNALIYLDSIQSFKNCSGKAHSIVSGSLCVVTDVCITVVFSSTFPTIPWGVLRVDWIQ